MDVRSPLRKLDLKRGSLRPASRDHAANRDPDRRAYDLQSRLPNAVAPVHNYGFHPRRMSVARPSSPPTATRGAARFARALLTPVADDPQDSITPCWIPDELGASTTSCYRLRDY